MSKHSLIQIFERSKQYGIISYLDETSRDVMYQKYIDTNDGSYVIHKGIMTDNIFHVDCDPSLCSKHCIANKINKMKCIGNLLVELDKSKSKSK